MRASIAGCISICCLFWAGPSQAGKYCVAWDAEGNCTAYAFSKQEFQLKLTGEPSGAIVTLSAQKDSKPLCSIPCIGKYAVPTNPVALTVSSSGYRSEEITVGSKDAWTRDVKLKKCPRVQLIPRDPSARESVEGVPEDSKIFVNGTLVGVWPESFKNQADITAAIAAELHQTPRQGCELNKEQYTFKVEHRDYFSWNSPPKELDAGDLYELKPRLERKSGTVIVISAVGDMIVYLDGQPIGKLPEATDLDVILEIPYVTPGEHVVSLQMPDTDRTDSEIWGDFSHETTVNVEAGETNQVTFQTTKRPIDRRDNPIWFDANLRQLAEQCEIDGQACVALGWAHRWGVGGPPNDAAAAAAFRAACMFDRDGVAAEEATEACTAYGWMLEMGLAGYAAREGDSPRDFFRCSPRWHASSDSVSPCVRAHMSRESQRTVDPTVHVEHEPANVSGRGALLVLGGWGEEQHFVKGALGFYGNIGGVTVDALFTVGWASVRRWDVHYTSRDWSGGAAIGLELGPGIRFGHFYGLVHFSLTGILHSFDDSGQNGGLFGGRVALGYTTGNSTRRGFFIEPGIMLEWATPEAYSPSEHQLVDELLASRNLDTFEQNWNRRKDASVRFLWTPGVTTGWVF